MVYNKNLYIFYGQSGAGKSTIVDHLCDNKSFKLFSDDYLLFDDKNIPQFTAYFKRKEEEYVSNIEVFENIKINRIILFNIRSNNNDFSIDEIKKEEMLFNILNNNHNLNLNFGKIEYHTLLNKFSENLSKMETYDIEYIKNKNSLEQIKKWIINLEN